MYTTSCSKLLSFIYFESLIYVLIIFVYILVPAAIQLNSQGEMHNMPTLTMSNATSTGGTILQYASQDGQFFVPGKFVKYNTNSLN